MIDLVWRLISNITFNLGQMNEPKLDEINFNKVNDTFEDFKDSSKIIAFEKITIWIALKAKAIEVIWYSL